MNTMKLRSGQKLHSAVCDAQVVVVRAPAAEVDVGCGGAPLLGDGHDAPAAAELDTSLGDPAQLGKRYADDEAGLELLCTRSGAGALTLDGVPLPMKGAKPLPASD
jgi:hypothetical protein